MRPATAGGARRLVVPGIAAAAALIAVLVPATTTSASAARSAKLNVVHGIPGVKAKVCLDGTAVIRGFTYGEKVVGVAVPSGRHRVRVVAAGKPCGAAELLKDSYRLKAGRSYTIVAAVRPSGAPALRAFGNDVGPIDAGKARLSVRHTAQAPAVNVWAGSVRLIGGDQFTWGDGRTFRVPRGDYRVRVTLPGSRKAVIGPTRLALKTGRAYQVYAVGTPGHYRLIVLRAAVGTS
jgi:hypothetical protein